MSIGHLTRYNYIFYCRMNWLPSFPCPFIGGKSLLSIPLSRGGGGNPSLMSQQVGFEAAAPFCFLPAMGRSASSVEQVESRRMHPQPRKFLGWRKVKKEKKEKKQ